MKSQKHINYKCVLTFSVYAPSSEKKNRDRDVAAAAVRLVFCAFSFCGCGAVNVLAMHTPVCVNLSSAWVEGVNS